MRALLLRLTSAAAVPGTDRQVFVLSGEAEVRIETNAPRWLEKLSGGDGFRMTIEPEAAAEPSE